MSIRKRFWGDGKEAWQVDLIIRGKRVREQRPTKAEARALELELRRMAKEGTYMADGGKVTLAQLAPKYIEHLNLRHRLKKKMQSATRVYQLGHIRNWIIGGVPIVRGRSREVFKSGIGSYKLTDLTPRVVEKFLDEVLAFGRAVKTVKEVRTTLSGLLEFARKEGYLATNPARGASVTPDRNAKIRRRVVPPSKALVWTIVNIAGADALAIKFAALTGLRASEQWALRWQHIDFARGYVKVETRVDRYFDEDGPKTIAGFREVPMAQDLVTDLLEWRSRTAYPQVSDLVFPNKKGRYWLHQTFKEYHFYPHYKAALKLLTKSEKRPRWHDLRHFAVSCWIEAGLPPKAIQEFAGHADLAVTMNTYGHLFPSEDHRVAMDKISADFSSQSVSVENR